MNKKKKPGRMSVLWKHVRFKYKLSFFNEGALEEVWSFRISGLSAIATLLVNALFLIAVTSIIIIKTPIRNYLPGVLDAEVREEIMQNALRADSLERMVAIQSLYLDNISGILMGTTPLDSIRDIDSLAQANHNYEIPIGEAESNFVTAFEEEEKYNLSVLATDSQEPVDGIFFYKPVNGILSSSYDTDLKHYGIDLVTAPHESVLATLDGTVVYAGYDSKVGNVIQIQHKNGFLSIYKHNEFLLKEIGNQVVAGEAIAVVGNTGDLSTGPHLHFELWYRGQPVDPEEYIVF